VLLQALDVTVTHATFFLAPTQYKFAFPWLAVKRNLINIEAKILMKKSTKSMDQASIILLI
jgi:hypothetical protein